MNEPEPDYARRAAALLAQAPVPEAPPLDLAAERAAVAAMEAALRAPTAPRRAAPPALKWAALAAAVLLAVGATFAAFRPAAGPSVVASASSVGTFTSPGRPAQPLAGGAVLPQSSRVVTPAGGTAALEFSTGTRVELSEGSELTLDALGAQQRLHVAGGRVFSHVAKVPPQGAFVVATRDAEIEVKGTRFSVEVVPRDPRCEVQSITRVTVEEGVVAVRFDGREHTLRAGERWPADCFATAADEAAPASSLAAQNDLFAQAVALKRQGDASGAIALFEHLMEAWPQGPLAESAEVERMKLLGARDGAAAARAYLAHYPKGFARTEAAALVQTAK